MNKLPVFILLGTRPEAIKQAPVVLKLQQSSILIPVICSSGQHKEMLSSALADFDLAADIDLALMRPGQQLDELTSRLFEHLGTLLRQKRPAAILVQGDTTTALAGAMCGFFQGIPVGHVEAGLRSGNMQAPFPEEFNRRAAALATTWHFAPTEGAASNLLHEGINSSQVFVTGNTVVDALHLVREKIRTSPPPLPAPVEEVLVQGRPYVLITGHRRENFGQGMEDICAAIAALATQRPDWVFIYPVHLNPQVRTVVNARLEGFSNILLTEPCAYRPFLRLLDKCTFVLSDSGGIQEEAPSFGKRVLVMRDTTERPEGVTAGVCRLVGTNVTTILEAAQSAFQHPSLPEGLSNPYGDGHAAERIVAILEKQLVTKEFRYGL